MVARPLCRLAIRVVLIGIALAVVSRVWANPPAPMIPPRDRGVQASPAARQDAVASFIVRRDGVRDHSRIIIPEKFLPSRRPARSGFSLDDHQQKATNAGLLLATLMTGGGLTVVFIRRRNVAAAVALSAITLVLTIAVGTAMAKSPPPNPPALNPAFEVAA